MGPTDTPTQPSGTVQGISDVTAANLRAEIARRGMNRRDFGVAMGWSKNTTTNKLMGRSPLTLNELDRAATIVDVELVSLLAPPAPRTPEAAA